MNRFNDGALQATTVVEYHSVQTEECQASDFSEFPGTFFSSQISTDGTIWIKSQSFPDTEVSKQINFVDFLQTLTFVMESATGLK